jgi:peptide/nickel transport system permease protein
MASELILPDTLSTEDTDVVLTPAKRRRPSRFLRALALAGKYPLGVLSGVLLLLFAVSALFAGLIAPYSPTEMGLGASFAGPSLDHPFGLDQLGRDVLSRVIWGSRISLLIGVTATASALLIGVTLGIVSPYFGGRFDLIIQRVIETVDTLPSLVFALLLVSVFGQSTTNIIIAMAVTLAPRMSRVVRSAALTARGLPHVDATRSLGASDARLMLRHVLPSTFGPIMVMATLTIGNAITVEASLAFLGIGGSPDSVSWGRMLAQAGAEYIRHAPHLAYFPGIAITLIVLAANFAGDTLRDAFDPRARRR